MNPFEVCILASARVEVAYQEYGEATRALDREMREYMGGGPEVRPGTARASLDASGRLNRFRAEAHEARAALVAATGGMPP